MNLKEEAQKLLRANRRVTDGHQYTVPSPETYPYQWLWDSCFHAIVLAGFDAEAGKEEIRSLLTKQLPTGMIPHIIYWESSDLLQYDWGIKKVSAITQPPMIAYAAWELYRKTGDFEFLKEIYPAIFRFYKYLIEERDTRHHHLVGIINPDESGEDNSPRFDSILMVPSDISLEDHLRRRLELVDANRICSFDAELCMSRHFWVKDVPFNAMLVENLEILGHIASLLKNPDDEHFINVHKELVKGAMRERMFKDGIFWSIEGITHKMLSVATWAHFAPLFAGLYSQEEAEATVKDHLNNKKTFQAKFGIRTVSKEEPSYRPDGFWRGPIWMAVNWFIYRGLARYGFQEEAKKIKDQSVALLEKSGFREYYHPETGEGLGAKNFTWGSLVLDMEEEQDD